MVMTSTPTRSTLAAQRTPTRRCWMLCHDSGLSMQRHTIPSEQRANGKTGRGDLVIKDANLDDCRHVIVDAAFIHELS